MRAFKTTLIASLIATAVGIWTMALGITRAMWPAHPQWMAFILTFITVVLVQYAWPRLVEKK